MKELGESVPVDKTASNSTSADDFSEKVSSTMGDEMQIEKEVLQNGEEANSDVKEVTWDGSESEFVEDDDAEVYEEKYAGIKFGYVLKKEEIFSCLKHTGMFKGSGTRSIVEMCLLLVLALMFFVLFFVTGNNFNFILGGIFIALIVAVAVAPRLFIGFNADKLTTGRKLFVEIYPDEIEVDGGASAWKIPLDGSSLFEEFNDMFLLYLPEDKLFIVPIRAIEPDFLADVQAMIVAGTTPKEEE